MAENLVKGVKEKYPDANISLTGHSLGGALASYVAAMCNVQAVTFNSPSVVGLLPKDMQQEVKEGKYDNQIVNYVNPRDSISAGAFKEYERHIGSTYYIGTLFEYENAEINPFSRFLKSISEENYHALDHYTFDEYGNINNAVITNVVTGKMSWQSPRFFSNSVASIEVTPRELEDTAERLDAYINRIEDLCNDIKRTANRLDNVKKSEYVVDEVIQSAQQFNVWFSQKTLEIKHNLKSSALAYIEADKLHD
ncbi:lipase family protein [Bacillus sp. F19]|nr:lipase family protein [Bacillus sp. F19]